MMTSPETSGGDPVPLQFLPRLQALPLVHSAFCLASDIYLASKARYQRMNPLFNLAEGAIVRVSTTTSYCASALVSLLGGWEALDGWACQGLDKLESFAPIIKKPTKEIKREFVLKLLTLVEDEEVLERIKAELVKESNTDDDTQEANTQESCNCLDLNTNNQTLDERSFITAEDIQFSGKHLVVPGGPRITRGLSLDSVYKTPMSLEESKTRKVAYSLATLSDSRDNAQKIPWWKKVFQKRPSISPQKYEDPNLHIQGGLHDDSKVKDNLLTRTGKEEGDGVDHSIDKHSDLENKTDDQVDNRQVNSESQIENFTPEKRSFRSHSPDNTGAICMHDGSPKLMKYSFENCEEEEPRERVWSTSTPQSSRKKDLEEATEQISRSSFRDDKSQEERQAEKELIE